jgi:hypothetical protein
MAWVIAGAIAAIVGTAVSTYAVYAQAEQQQKAAKAESQFREQEAESARQSAAYQERQYRRRVALLLGKQEAIAGASGTDPSSGSPLLMELDNVRQGEMEALNIRRTGEATAFGREYEARLARQRASFASQQKGFAVAGGVTKAAGSILGGWYGRSGSYYSRNPGLVQEP